MPTQFSKAQIAGLGIKAAELQDVNGPVAKALDELIAVDKKIAEAEAEVARLKGKRVALEDEANEKNAALANFFTEKAGL